MAFKSVNFFIFLCHIEWSPFVSREMKKWLSLHLAWANDSTPLHVLVYHRLVASTEPELRDVLNFLKVPSLTPTIHCAARANEGLNHRKKQEWQAEAAVFSEEQRHYLNGAIDRAQRALHSKTGADLQDLQLWKR